jgi:hypothetical protein
MVALLIALAVLSLVHPTYRSIFEGDSTNGP